MNRTSVCPSCGFEPFPEDAFCSQCGTGLKARGPETGLARRTIVKETTATAERLACASCNSPILVGEVFCSTCGARFGPTTSRPGQREIRAELLGRLEEATRGRFDFVGEIGRGGMGAVYLARELDLDRNVAIKVLSSSWLTDESMIERFRREARTIASLRHPSIVHVHGVGRAEDIHYFVMDFIDGVSLGKILLTHGPLSIPATLAILGQVGSALNYAHRPGRSVIHRDIKPGNIMVDAEGNAYVTDFGISKATETHSGLTMTGLIMGTPEYMSPEQCRSDEAGPPADQYSLGCVAFAMLTGSPPFAGPPYRVLVAHTTEAAPSVREFRPDCPEPIAEAVARMLSKLPSERWPDIAQAMTALGARPTLPGDPVREELTELVVAARGHRDTGPTPEVARPRPSGRPQAEQKDKPTWLRILSVPASLETGEAIDLRARKGFADGREVENGDVSWQSTDARIARIDPDTGRLVAVGAGTAVITATVAGVEESVAVSVAPARVRRLSLEPSSLELEAGSTGALVAQARGKLDQVLDRPVLWSSSDPGVATVSAEGEVTSHREGTASLLAHCEGVGASATVTVVPARVNAVRFIDAPDSIRVGESANVSADARDARGNRIERAIAFSTTADTSTARVSPDGAIEAFAVGSITIIAECEDQSASTVIRVLPAPVASIAVEATDRPLTVGERVKLIATAFDSTGQPIDREFAWKSTDRSIVEVHQDGSCHAIAEGTADIIVASEGQIDRVVLDVVPVPVARIEVSQPPSELVEGDTFHLVATPVNAAGEPMQRPVDWLVDDEDVVEPLGSGRFRARAAGAASVRVRSGAAESAVELAVDRVQVASIVLQSVPDSIHVDDSVMLTAELRDQRGRLLERTVTWTASDPWIARVNARGVVEGAGPGTTTVTAECDGVSDSAAIVVTAAPWATVVLKRPETPVEAAPERPEEHVTAGNRRRLIVGVPIAIAAVAGALWIGLRGGEDAAAPPPIVAEPGVASVVVLDAAGGDAIPDAVDLVIGDTLRLLARPESDDGATVSTASVGWTSSDPSLAAIDADGVVVARGAGAVRIAARAGGISRELALTITAPAPASPVTAAAPPPSQPAARTQPTREVQEEQAQRPPPAAAVSPPAQTPPPDPPADGTLQLIVLPFADIWIDGEQKAIAQRGLELDLPPGQHRLRLENPNMILVDTTFTIVSGQARPLRITLTPRGM